MDSDSTQKRRDLPENNESLESQEHLNKKQKTFEENVSNNLIKSHNEKKDCINYKMNEINEGRKYITTILDSGLKFTYWMVKSPFFAHSIYSIDATQYPFKNISFKLDLEPNCHLLKNKG